MLNYNGFIRNYIMKYHSSRLGLSFDPAKTVTFIRQTAGIREDSLSDYQKGFLDGLEALLENVFRSLEADIKERIENTVGITKEEAPEAYDYFISRALGTIIGNIFPEVLIQVKKAVPLPKEISGRPEERDEILEARKRALREFDSIAAEWNSDHIVRKAGTVFRRCSYSGMGLEEEHSRDERKTEDRSVPSDTYTDDYYEYEEECDF